MSRYSIPEGDRKDSHKSGIAFSLPKLAGMRSLYGAHPGLPQSGKLLILQNHYPAVPVGADGMTGELRVVRTGSIFVLPLLVALAGGVAHAADMTAPVREVVNTAAKSWDGQDGDAEDVFSEDRLTRLFSVDFARTYREATHHPAMDPPEGETTGNPFDYDPIAGGQDGCAFEDIRVEDDGEGQVTALFKNHKCFGKDAANQNDTVLIFHVKTEKGHAVIDDIYPVENGQSGKSIKDELKTIIAQ